MMPSHSPFWLGIRWVYFHVCAVVTLASVTANLLPDSKFIQNKKYRTVYCWLVDYVALLALNFRVDLPSLDKEFMGFRRTLRHRYRNWRQHRVDGEFEKKGE